jgi:protein phosphatase
LIDEQYRPVGEAGLAGTAAAAKIAEQAAARGVDTGELAARLKSRAANAAAYDAARRRYARPARGIEDLRLAPFHVMASQGAVHSDKRHDWHMDLLHQLAQTDPSFLVATPYRTVTLGDADQIADSIGWWEKLTAGGGEGVVVKPIDFAARGKKGLVQPAIKCRGSEYLRIIYGPDYALPEHLERLRERGVGAKRHLAAKEFAHGVEALARFVAGEPLRRVHECVFAVLALESEPVDPRL